MIDTLVQIFVSLGGVSLLAAWFKKELPKIIARSHNLDEAQILMMRKSIIDFYNSHKNAEIITYYEKEFITEMGELYSEKLSQNGYCKQLLKEIEKWEVKSE
jgi:hypothetical protein